MSRLGRSVGADPERIATFMAMLERRPPLLTKIRRSRVWSKLTVAELAERVGMTEEHLAAIEAAQVRVVPSDLEISMIARELGWGFVELRSPDEESNGKLSNDAE